MALKRLSNFMTLKKPSILLPFCQEANMDKDYVTFMFKISKKIINQPALNFGYAYLTFHIGNSSIPLCVHSQILRINKSIDLFTRTKN